MYMYNSVQITSKAAFPIQFSNLQNYTITECIEQYGRERFALLFQQEFGL